MKEDYVKKCGHSLECFEKMLMELLQRYLHYQKQVAQLVQENEELKSMLRVSETGLIASTKVDKIKNALQPDGDTLVRQINAYIKEIDLCLAYFEQA